MQQQLKKGLGRGIDSLIPPVSIASGSNEQESPYRLVPIEKLVPNRQQPRTIFDEEKIRELADSIKQEGVLQPLIVSPLTDGRYELIAGERRLRAARLAGLEDVPVVIKSVDQENSLALSIVENIQREDLNAIEEARAYQELVERFHFSQEDIAARMGKSRAAVANSLRLLKLPRVIQEDIASGRYTAGHARALLALPNVHEQLKFRELLIKKLVSVRDVEQMVNARGDIRRKRAHGEGNGDGPHATLVEKLRQALGTKVAVKAGRNGAGTLVIEYYSGQDLDRLYRRILGAS